MPQVKIVRRWGSRQPGEVVELSETEANWLVGIKFAEDPNRPGSSRANAAAPGADGPDAALSGDPTRRRPAGDGRSARVENGLTGRVQGAPARAGDVTHVADENLAESHREHRGDVHLASGKRLSEELEEQQAEIDEQGRKRDLGGSKGEKPKDGPSASGGSPAEPEGRRLTQRKKNDA